MKLVRMMGRATILWLLCVIVIPAALLFCGETAASYTPAASTALGGVVPPPSASNVPAAPLIESKAKGEENRLIELLKRIPQEFWGVVAGSFFTLLGVWLTNLASARRQREQLVHDRELRLQEREFSVRRDVYLSAAEAVTATFQVLGRHQDLDVPNDVLLAPYLGKAPAMSKVHVVGHEDTVHAFVTYGGALTAAFLRLGLRRARVLALKQALALCQAQLDAYGDERDTTLRMIKEEVLEPVRNDRRWNLLQQRFEYASSKANESIAEHGRKSEELTREHLELLRDVHAEIRGVSALLVPLVVSVRRELHMPIDAEKYGVLASKSLVQTQDLLQRFVTDLEALIAQQRAGER
jgi:hypothetical protein